jgi:hypothetical protein
VQEPKIPSAAPERQVVSFTIDSNLLSSYYQAKLGTTLANASGGGGQATVGGKPKYAPTAPWATNSTALRADALVKQAMAGRSLINENAAQLDLKGASEDYKKLFALYQGLNSLYGLAEKASGKGVSALDLGRMQKVFTRGLTEVADYADTLKLEQARLTRGDAMLQDKATIGVPKNKYEYVTDVLHTGASTDEVPAFAGDAAFDIKVKTLDGEQTIAIDLDDLGSQPRTMSNVINHINSKLQDAGLRTRFAVERTKGEPRQIPGVNGKTITLPAVGDDFAIKVKGDSAEKVTFEAVSRPAVYVTTYSGDPDPDKNTKTDDGVFENRLVKIDPAGATGPETRIKTETLEGTIGTVRTSQVGPDGSLYMLAEVEKSADGQAIKGEKDVALLKYDSAGKLMYARTLGASDEATGLAMSISSDGKVAIAGAVTGSLQGATNGPINSGERSTKADSFVTLFDTKGDEVWTARRGALDEDEATAVAFGDDGSVYVAGRTKSSMPGGGGEVGGWDGYVTAYAADVKGVPKTLFTKQFGTTGEDTPTGLVVDGDQVYVASRENGRGVVRSFETSLTTTKTTKSNVGQVLTVTVETFVDGASTGSTSTQYANPAGTIDYTSTSSVTSAATLTDGATRDLGDLQGGTIAGLKIEDGKLYVAGQTRNAALAVDGETRAHAGGLDAFAASLSTDLTSHADDALAYYGGAGDNTVAGMTVSGGKVWLVGAAGEDLPGLTATGKKEGYVAALDVATGTVSGAQRISGKDGVATATSVAVDPNGVSALDKFGLPSGTLDYEQSQSLVSSTSARPGDQFQIRTRAGGVPATITIEAKDTLQTLAAKVRRVSSGNAKVEVVSDGDNRVLKISPARDNAIVEVMPGKGGKNVLDALGLAEGMVRKTEFVDGKARTVAPGGEIYGLGLKTDIDLSDKDAIKRAMDVLGASLGKIRTVYRDLEAAAKPKSATTPNVSGPVPAYLTAQIANYQAGLNRLMGG